MHTSNRSFAGLERCPYLGLHDDQSTSLAYPSAWNYCYHASPPASVLVSHQVEACLCPQYMDCALNHSNHWGRMPRSLRGKAGGSLPKNGSWGRLLRLIAFALFVALLILLTLLDPSLFKFLSF